MNRWVVSWWRNKLVRQWLMALSGRMKRKTDKCLCQQASRWVGKCCGMSRSRRGQAWVERGWLKGRSKRRGWVGALKALRHQNWKSVSSTSQDFTMSLRKLETLHHLVPTIPWWLNLQRTWSSPSSYLCSIPYGEQSLESKGLALVCPGSHEKQASSFQHPDFTRLDRESIKSKEESSATSSGMTTSLSATGLSFIGGQSWGI